MLEEAASRPEGRQSFCHSPSSLSREENMTLKDTSTAEPADSPTRDPVDDGQG